jgi:anti-sigma regulatory factor (Ser/Thr protein kinase)
VDGLTLHFETIDSLAQLAEARAWIGEVLDGCDVRVDDAALLVTELLSNAIRHAGTIARLVVTIHPDHIRLAVSDRSGDAPVMSSRPDAAGGYGLRLVETVSARWGWQPTADGKTVWCDLQRAPA